MRPAPGLGGKISRQAAIEHLGRVKDTGQAVLFGQSLTVETDTSSTRVATDREATTEELVDLFTRHPLGPFMESVPLIMKSQTGQNLL